MPSVRILLLCIGAAVLYGEVHDQVTARLCIEYFTVAHPHVMESVSPMRHALYWGFAATWWVGVLLGLPLALVCRAGIRPRLAAPDLVRPIGMMLIVMSVCALLSGLTGFFLYTHGVISADGWETWIPAEKLKFFMADSYAHLASYGSGFAGGLGVSIRAALQRRRLARAAEERTREGALSA